ncbi:MAG: polyphosphate:AMP phosphotransferase [Methylococcaceae bacterium]|nr:polyphosphate:AMP phosphotransferase [Methylococcaceae bacterium]
MFESAALEHKIDKGVYKAELPGLREDLLNAQFDLFEATAFPVIILIAGIDGDGKSQAINDLNAILDTHYVTTVAMGPASKDDRKRPPMGRFWSQLPSAGRMAIFIGSWYSEPLRQRVTGRSKDADLHKSLEEINRFERMLADEGALILKFWFHLTEEQQKQRRKKFEAREDRHRKTVERFFDSTRNYAKILSAADRVMRITSTGYAPWIVIGGTDKRYRGLKIAKTLLHALKSRLAGEHPPVPASAPVITPHAESENVIANLDLARSLKRSEYKVSLKRLQIRLQSLCQAESFSRSAVVAVFEGNDAAGKGGTILRLTEALDADLYRVYQIGAPSEDERAKPYLWRFWRAVPRLGQLAYFDRSWYGRVLVERIEGYCSESDWMRAYREINDFETELDRHGVIVVKFWLAISPEEQLKRFKEREQTGYKRHKITDEDWRNREKWDQYNQAACDMIDRTSTEHAPWTLVEANDKYYARIKVLKTLCKRVELRL